MAKYKIIRDNLINVIDPDLIERCDDRNEIVDFLKEKLYEEIEELIDCDFRDPDEFGDILEVLYALADFSFISKESIELARLEKKQKRGAFTKGILYKLED